MNTVNYKNFVLRVISMLVQFVLTLILTRIVVQYINEEAYGFFQLSNDFVNYAMVVSIALNSMASRFITLSYYKKDYSNVNSYYNSVFYGDVLLSCGFAIILFIIAINLDSIISIPKSDVLDIKILFGLMFANFIITVATSVFGAATFVKNRIDLDSLRTIESNFLKVLVTFIFFIVLKPRVWFVAIGTLVGTTYITLRNIYYTKILLPEVSLFKKKYFKKQHIIELLNSGFWNSFTKIGSILLSGLDLLIANQLIGATAMGMLSISKTIPKYIFASAGNIASAFTPSILIEYAKGNRERLVSVIIESIKILSVISIVIEVIVIILGKQLFQLWVPGQNADILQQLSMIAMIGYIVLLPFEVLWCIFTATNKVKISSIYLMTESVIVIVTVIILLRYTESMTAKMMIIAGTSSVFELIRGCLFLPLMSAKLLGLPKGTFYKPLVKVILTVIISVCICFFENKIFLGNGWFSFIVEGLCIAATTLIICSCILFDSQERKRIWNKVINKLNNIQKKQ